MLYGALSSKHSEAIWCDLHVLWVCPIPLMLVILFTISIGNITGRLGVYPRCLYQSVASSVCSSSPGIASCSFCTWIALFRPFQVAYTMKQPLMQGLKSLNGETSMGGPERDLLWHSRSQALTGHGIRFSVRNL